MDKKWQVVKRLQTTAGRVDETTVINTLLENRAIKDPDYFFKPPKVEEILDGLDTFFLDLNINQLKKASKRVKKALTNGEKVAIWGDYDVDGICSTAVLWQVLHDLGVNVTPYIPDRFSEGYGLNTEGIKKLKDNGVRLIITVDSGITAAEEVASAVDLGIDVIVTDHHIKPKNLPKAHSIVHTTNLCGTGVAWVLSAQLAKSKRKVTQLLDLVAIATVADMQPLTGANRSLVKEGFKVLNRLERPGLAALVEASHLEKGSLGSYAAGWILGPRINAVGRAGEISGGLTLNLEALRLLCTNNITQARELAHVLSAANLKRRSLTESVMEAALTKVEGKGLIVVFEDGWHEGVIGLVAGRLVTEYGRPAVVIAKGEEFSKGSARSINGLDILKVLRENKNLLEDVGGHEAAAGFTVRNENLDQFISDLKSSTREAISRLDPRPILKIDMELPLDNLTYSLVNALEDFKPYGMGNPEPLFVAWNVDVISSRFVGKDKTHLKLNLAPGFEAIWFGALKKLERQGRSGRLSRGDRVSVVFAPNREKWKGKEKLVLKITDLKID